MNNRWSDASGRISGSLAGLLMTALLPASAAETTASPVAADPLSTQSAASAEPPASQPASRPISHREAKLHSAGSGAPGQERLDPRHWEKLTGDWGGLRDELDKIGVRFELSYQHQLQANFRGGLGTHNAHRNSGSYDANLRLDFEKMDLIPDAGFYFKFDGNWSESSYAGINPDKVGASGAARVNSDADDDDSIYVNKWWYWQRFLDGRIELRLGRIATQKDLFDVSLYANHEDKDFLNRLLIRNATIPHRKGMGAFLRYEPTDWLYLQAAAVDAQSVSRNCYEDFETPFHDEAWFLGMWEFGFTPKWDSPKGPMFGRYRAGLWYDPTGKEVYKTAQDTDDDGDADPTYQYGDVGFYAGLDQMIWKENDDPHDPQGLGLFTRYGYAHGDVNEIDNYWGAGLSWRGLIPGRDRDVTAFGVSQAIRSSQYRRYVDSDATSETVYEWYYKIFVTPWFIVTPDLQIVTNPGGEKDARDAIVGGVRVRILF